MLGISIRRKSRIQLSRQIADQIRFLILESRLAAGTVLPSTRELAKHLAVSRNTVTIAYEMLWAEGYIHARQGARFAVDRITPLFNSAKRAKNSILVPTPVRRRIRFDFRTGIPDLSYFPFKKWQSIQRHILEKLTQPDLLYGDTEGYSRLRNALSEWLLRSRGVLADAKNIFITSGATHAISLAIDAVSERKGAFILEKPGHFGVEHQVRQRNLPYLGVPVDENGLCMEMMPKKAIAGVYVTPSHQFPLGCVMSAARRAQLVNMAREKGFCIIEDDYDSEYRFAGPPLSPLYALDSESVIYVGTFSKTLFPALRIGYAIVPQRLQKSWLAARRYTDIQNSIVEQAVLSEFLERRMMDMFIKKTTSAYNSKRQLLKKAIAKEFGESAAVLGDAAGLHMAVRLEGKRLAPSFPDICRENDILLGTSAGYAPREDTDIDTLILGYGMVAAEDIAPGIQKLAGILRKDKG